MGLAKCALALASSIIAGVVVAVAPATAATPTPAAACNGTWTDVPSYNHSQLAGEIDSLTAVAALSATDQWAVGYWLQFPDQYTFHTLVEHWDGSSSGWTVVSSPNGQFRNSYLSGIAVISPDDVWAVGATDQSGPPYESLVEHWDGTSWSIVSAASFPGLLYSVVALGPSNIWAVGTRNFPGSALIEHWDGTSWSAQYLRTTASLRGVTASAANDVWAVGYEWGSTGITAGIETTFTVHFNGRRWMQVPSPSPLTRFAQDQSWLTAVTSTGAKDVWAVGWFGDADRGINGQTLIEHFNGSHWTVVPSPNPTPQPGAPSQSDSLWGAAAVGPADIWAVGSIGGTLDVNPDTQPLVARWDGTSWTASSAAPNQSGQLLGVAAEPEGSGLSAVGDTDTTVFLSTLAEHLCPG